MPRNARQGVQSVRKCSVMLLRIGELGNWGAGKH